MVVVGGFCGGRPIHAREVELFITVRASSLIASKELELIYSVQLAVPPHLYHAAAYVRCLQRALMCSPFVSRGGGVK